MHVTLVNLIDARCYLCCFCTFNGICVAFVWNILNRDLMKRESSDLHFVCCRRDNFKQGDYTDQCCMPSHHREMIQKTMFTISVHARLSIHAQFFSPHLLWHLLFYSLFLFSYSESCFMNTRNNFSVIKLHCLDGNIADYITNKLPLRNYSCIENVSWKLIVTSFKLVDVSKQTKVIICSFNGVLLSVLLPEPTPTIFIIFTMTRYI